MPASSNYVLNKGKNASAAFTKKRFVKFDTAATDHESVKMCDAQGEMSCGVTLFSVSAAEILKGKGASVQMGGIAVVEASAALAEGTLVTTGTTGKAEAAASGDYVLGEVIEPSTADATECSVLLCVPHVL
jgi:hypothetical protein